MTKNVDKVMLNKGYDQGFNGKKAEYPKDEDYMAGYRIGVADANTRKKRRG